MTYRSPITLTIWGSNLVGSDMGYVSMQYWVMYVSMYDTWPVLFRPTPVDPAGPDCYQSGTKPCESTPQGVAYGSVTRSQHAQGTWITSGN